MSREKPVLSDEQKKAILDKLNAALTKDDLSLIAEKVLKECREDGTFKKKRRLKDGVPTKWNGRIVKLTVNPRPRRIKGRNHHCDRWIRMDDDLKSKLNGDDTAIRRKLSRKDDSTLQTRRKDRFWDANSENYKDRAKELDDSKASEEKDLLSAIRKDNARVKPYVMPEIFIPDNDPRAKVRGPKPEDIVVRSESRRSKRALSKAIEKLVFDTEISPDILTQEETE